jgi:DNA polymerase III subunit epsilon
MIFTVVDVETTGYPYKGIDRVVEIGVVLCDSKSILQTKSTLVRAPSDISPFVERLTGISNAMVANAPCFAEIASEYLSFINQGLFTAHNVAFDYKVLQNEFNQCGAIDGSAGGIIKNALPAERLCTLKLARQVFPGVQGGHGLGNLHKALSLGLSAHHRALDDALATARLLQLILQTKSEPWVQSQAIGYIRLDKLPKTISAQSIRQMPQNAGVFRLYSAKNQLLYIQSASNLQRSVIEFFHRNKKGASASIKEGVCHIEWDIHPQEITAKLAVADVLISKRPPGNPQFRAPVFAGDYLAAGLYLVQSSIGNAGDSIALYWDGVTLVGWRKIAGLEDARNVHNVQDARNRKQYTAYENGPQLVGIFRRWLSANKQKEHLIFTSMESNEN